MTVPAKSPSSPQQILDAARAAGVPACRLGVTGGDVLMLPAEGPVSVAKLREVFEGWLPAYMAGAA